MRFSREGNLPRAQEPKSQRAIDDNGVVIEANGDLRVACCILNIIKLHQFLGLTETLNVKPTGFMVNDIVQMYTPGQTAVASTPLPSSRIVFAVSNFHEKVTPTNMVICSTFLLYGNIESMLKLS